MKQSIAFMICVAILVCAGVLFMRSNSALNSTPGASATFSNGSESQVLKSMVGQRVEVTGVARVSKTQDEIEIGGASIQGAVTSVAIVVSIDAPLGECREWASSLDGRLVRIRGILLAYEHYDEEESSTPTARFGATGMCSIRVTDRLKDVSIERDEGTKKTK